MDVLFPQMIQIRLRNALLDLLSKPKDVWKPAFDVICGRFKWSEVVDPLRRYILEGNFAADHIVLGRNSGTSNAAFSNIWRSRFARTRYILKNQGFKALLVKIAKYIRTHLTKLF